MNHCSLDFVRQIKQQMEKNDMSKESVLVVSKNTLFDCQEAAGETLGGLRLGLEGFEKLLDPARHTYLPRESVETDEDWLQIVPYVMVRHPRPDNDDGDWFLGYVRPNEQMEDRLAGRHSIGIGGHVSQTDNHAVLPHSSEMRKLLTMVDVAALSAPVARGLVREISEELVLRDIRGCQPVGLIYDSSTTVGRVHLGVAMVLDVASTSLASNDAGVTNLQWMSYRSLHTQRDMYESWSRFCIWAIGNRLLPPPRN
jgi:predicted NUDIX family phosphoesterase